VDDTIVLVGIGITTFTILVMQLVKAIWPSVQDRLAVAITVVVGVVLSYLAQAINLYPDKMLWITPILIGLATAAEASGVYSWTKRRS
jgi:di/tricarboxylate transporter